MDENDITNRLVRLETKIEILCDLMAEIKAGFAATGVSCRDKHDRLEARIGQLESESAQIRSHMSFMQWAGLVVATALSGVVAMWSRIFGAQ